jgi:DMSO/TMAO reductase YedYZ heme-binding membrane subunit
MKLSWRVVVTVLAAVGLMIVAATDQILPATSAYQAQMRVWMAARATGLVALILIALLVVLGIMLSHPEQTQWKLAKRIYPWHESLWVFVFAFLVVHVVSLVIDPYAGVGIGGALVPGMSQYRSAPVAIGVIALYAMLITAMTARYTRMLPTGWWLKLHRLSGLVLAMAWAHGVFAGSDTKAFSPVYWGIVVAVVAAGAHRYWIVRRARAAQRQAHPALLIPARPLVEEAHVQSHPAP